MARAPKFPSQVITQVSQDKLERNTRPTQQSMGIPWMASSSICAIAPIELEKIQGNLYYKGCVGDGPYVMKVHGNVSASQ